MEPSHDNLVAFAKSYGADEFILTKTWDTFTRNQENANAIDLLRATDPFKVPGAFIHGPPGAGKTHAMKAVFNHILRWRVEQHESGYFLNVRPFWANLSFYLERLRQDDYAAKKKALDSTTLFLDDLGASTKTDWAVDQIFQLIDFRAERELQTFITSNWNLEELGKNYGSRISSRIKAICIPVAMFCADHRNTQMKNNTAALLERIKKGSE